LTKNHYFTYYNKCSPLISDKNTVFCFSYWLRFSLVHGQVLWKNLLVRRHKVPSRTSRAWEFHTPAYKDVLYICRSEDEPSVATTPKKKPRKKVPRDGTPEPDSQTDTVLTPTKKKKKKPAGILCHLWSFIHQ
jgi:hypothetical protein